MGNKNNQHYCCCCGAAIVPNSKKCPECGQRYRKVKAGVVILLVAFVLVLLAAGFYYTFELMPSKQAVDPTAELAAEEIYRLASPATVEIRVETEYGPVTGTGFFSDIDGTIITNFHVLEDAISGVVYLNNGEKYDIMKLVGFDNYLDIAIVQIEYQPSNVLEMRTDLLQTGETVYALGSSLGLADSFSEGIISANQREIGGQIFIQTTTPISHGNSGGPLIDKYGRVVGITTAGIESGQNLNLAVPIANVKKVSNKYIVNFLGKLTVGEEFVLKQLNCSYWEWAKNPIVICDTETNLFHDGNCSWFTWLKSDLRDGYVDDLKHTFVPKEDLENKGYSHCPTCYVHVTMWGKKQGYT